LTNFKISETDTFIKKRKSSKYRDLYAKIHDCVYPLLRINPFFGPNIKKLKGDFKAVYRYRIGEYRLFYMIDNDIIYILTIANR